MLKMFVSFRLYIRAGFVATDGDVHEPKVQSCVPGTDHLGQADRSRPAAVRERRGYAVGHRGRR